MYNNFTSETGCRSAACGVKSGIKEPLNSKKYKRSEQPEIIYEIMYLYLYLKVINLPAVWGDGSAEDWRTAPTMDL